MALVLLHAAAMFAAPDAATIVSEVRIPADDALVLGADDLATFQIPNWSGPAQLLLSADDYLHLGPGMRVNMCGSEGENHLVGTYEELLAAGVSLPIKIARRRMNIRVRPGLTILTKYVVL